MSLEQETKSVVVEQDPKEGGNSTTVVQEGGEIKAASTPENFVDVAHKFRLLKEEYKDLSDQFQMKQNTERDYPDLPVKVFAGDTNVEINEALLKKKKSALQEMQEKYESMKPKKRHPFSVIRSAILHFFTF